MIGNLVHLSQMIEYNLLSILAGAKFIDQIESFDIYGIEDFNNAARESNSVLHTDNEKTLGYLLDKATKEKIFTKDFADVLLEVKDKRNFYVHQIFKKDLLKNNFYKNPSVYLKELGQTIALMSDINNILVDIFRHFKGCALSY